MRFAKEYLSKGGFIERIKKELYDSVLPTRSVIKTSLEYVSHHWLNMDTCDLWEEVRGDFFYTRFVQRSSLLMASEFALEMDDPGASQWYLQQATTISETLDLHWSQSLGYIVSGLNNQGESIRSGLDISVILAIIQTPVPDTTSFSATDDRVLATIQPLVDSFDQLYNVNREVVDSHGRLLGPAMGRYPEDVYDGIGVSLGMQTIYLTKKGNPWYLATTAIAEYLYTVSRMWRQQKRIQITERSLGFFQKFLEIPLVQDNGSYTPDTKLYKIIQSRLISKGDAFLRRVKHHSVDGRLSEEFTRDKGLPRGAQDLTWSYAALLTVSKVRLRALEGF